MALFFDPSYNTSNNNNKQSDPIIHEGFVCDRCGQNPIKGIRYKCTSCPDFDLCSACEALDLHDPKHLFLKVIRPLKAMGQIPPLFNESLYDVFDRIEKERQSIRF